MNERVPLKPKRTCECPLTRQGHAGAIRHRSPCHQKQGMEWLAQSGDTITIGQRYRWINGDDQWSRDRGYPETNVVAEVTGINSVGMIFGYWEPQSDQRSQECCIPNCAVVEMVDDAQ